ncbi:GH39 family glycosyl hydrolase [Bogoriella caseilytica]|uniref:Xylan 1,4-beta-xylosidase n=1 Tax=Bogoriella caseilytica TaxID=56055 RepID=A0A3N2BCU7_9MICO|nr:xylan 1,4-beta-xylosidase [Bogoriella caseilytica]ROR73069.1 xylan 1,4-beta-xylosidase [Bogoriella caseilytica]
MIHVPATPIGELSNAWRECVGTGRFSLALRSDYRDSLALAQQEIGFRYIRGHGILGDDVGIHRPYDDAGHRGVLQNFTYIDQVIDTYLELGIKPFLELGFMPEALASGAQTVFWWQGNVTPPRDLSEWAALIRGLLRHLIGRYGIEEVRTWPVEVWNEPNLSVFWSADQDAYHQLYEASAIAVKEVDADLQVGGPSLSPGSDEWWAPFADFVTRRELPVDFVSRHAYTSGPAQHVPLGVYQSLQRPQALLEQFDAPRRHLEGTALAGLPVHITEFNSSYRPDNPVHDTAYNAAYLAPVLAAGGEIVDSMSYWTFSDMFEEAGVPSAIFHGGFGMLTHRQIKKPTFHLYAFMARMGAEVLARGEDHLVTRHDDGRIAVLAWQPVGGSEDEAEPPSHRVRLSVPLPGAAAGGQTARQSAFVMISSVDETEGNAWAAWQEMGRPRSPRARQLDLLHAAAEPMRRHRSVPVEEGRVALDLTLGRHGVSLVEIDPVQDETPPWLDDRRILGRGPYGDSAP